MATQGSFGATRAATEGDATGPATSYAVVVPTVGRECLARMLHSLAQQDVDASHPGPTEVVIVDDRRGDTPGPLPVRAATERGLTVRVVRGYGRGPAHARNRGWRVTTAPWVVFLDDDVVLPMGWVRRLADDLRTCTEVVGGVQGRIVVPCRSSRPTDWERNTAALERACWATADMAYRRHALADVGGFDERFPRAFREDADLALRVRDAGWQLAGGTRHIMHPVRPADVLVSARVQAGNADDALMGILHGRHWRERAGAPRGAFRRHVLTVSALGVAGLTGLLSGSSHGRSWVARGALAAWGGLTGSFLVRRLRPGPRPGDPGFSRELAAVTVTSVLIPPLAVGHRLAGRWRHHSAVAWPPSPRAVLWDRDGTLVHDVPYNTDPALVVAVGGAADAVQRVRSAGLKTGVVSNQSAIGRGLADAAQVEAVDARVDQLLGPFDTWQRCPHTDDDGCRCRKPAPGLVLTAARALRVRPSECVVIGDIGVDVEAAVAAGAHSILVPTAVTRPEEVANAPVVAHGLAEAIDLVFSVGAAARTRGR